MVQGKKERRIIIIIIRRRNGAKTISLPTLFGRLNKRGSSPYHKRTHIFPKMIVVIIHELNEKFIQDTISLF